MSDVWLISTPQSTQIMETKKTWEYVSLRAYPITQALALPPDKDKQLEACPRQRLYIHIHYGLVNPRMTEWKNHGYMNPRTPSFAYICKERAPLKGVHLIIYIKGNDSRRRDIKSTHVDVSRCITAVSGFKFARFEWTDSNVKKTSFRDWPYNWPEVSFHRC